MSRLGLAERGASGALSGPVRVVAGAGTGKTAVIADRFRRLLESGVEASAILVMTFTERAAAEMRQRILAETGRWEAPHVGTFHSLALRWLREEAARLGLKPGFRILTGPDRWILLRELVWECGDPALLGAERPDDLVAPLLKLQERLKQELVPLDRLTAAAQQTEDVERRELLAAAARLFRLHAARCRRERLLDFDDLLLHAVRLFEDHPDVRARYRARFPWIMVDEYQDTNLAQERVIELLAGPGGNVCVVGDDDQSIYRFRGASRASMERFLVSFPASETLTLGFNQRSSAAIVEAARRLIEHNPDRLMKALSAAPGARPGEPLEVRGFATGEEEAEAVAEGVRERLLAGTPPSEIAVLVRTHAIARPFAEALAAAGVRFRHWAANGLLQRPEVRDVVAYLRLLNDPGDLLALSRLLVRPPLRLDLKAALRVVSEGSEGGTTASSALQTLAGWAPTTEWASRLLELGALKVRLGVQDLLFELLNRTRHLEGLLAASPDSLERSRISANLGCFAEFVAEFCEERRDHSLARFVEHLELVVLSGVGLEEAELEAPEAAEAVHLMTIHQAKGLEFDTVFVPSLVEGRLPQAHRREALELPARLLEPAVRGRADHVAEERRLCYVAMTRARRWLILSWAERYEGERVWRASRFLEEVAGNGPTVRRREPQGIGAAGAAGPAADGRSGAEPATAAETEPGEALTLSFSAISSYRECPRQHWYRYQLRLPAPPSLEAQFGTVLHVVLMRAGQLRREGGEVGLEVLRELYRESWEAVALAEPRRRPTLEALGWRLLRGFWEQGGLRGRPYLVEAPFTANLDGWRLRGIIDRVDELPPPTQEGGGRELSGAELAERRPLQATTQESAHVADGRASARWRLIDYKSGRPVRASRLRRDLQLALYALGARLALGLDPLELEIVYLKDARRVVLAADEELLGEARRIGAEVAAGVRAGHFEPRPERRRCSLCPYRLACDAAL